MEINNLSEQNSILSRFVAELRDVNIQTDPLRFRRNLERIGEIMAYEISKKLEYNSRTVETPLGTCTVELPEENIVLATILRAGIGFHHGFLNYYDGAENAFVSAYRKYKENHLSFNVHIEYIASPSLDGKVLIITDPMLATGESMELSHHTLLTCGTPRQIHVATIIASEQGIRYCQEKLPDAALWVAAIDPELDESSYIVPGLGDAGNLAYGEKL